MCNVQQSKHEANTGRRKSDGALVALMLHAGLRVSEACSIKVTDVKISERKGTVVIRQGKGVKRCGVPLNRSTRDVLQAWLFSRDSQTDWFFPGCHRERLGMKPNSTG